MSVTAVRTRLSKDARRAQLVEKGLELLASRPLDQLTLEDVAVAAGISRALPFHYFPTRQDFLISVVEAAADDLLIAGDAGPDLPPPERLRAGLDGYMDYIEQNPAAYVAIVRGAAGADVGLVAVFERTRQTIVDRIVEALDPADRTELIRLAIRGWVAMAEESTVTWLRDRRSVSRRDLVWLLEEAFFRTVAAIVERPTTQNPER